MRFETFQSGPGAAFMRDPAAAARTLRGWAWPLKVGLVSAAIVAAVPLLLTAVVALGTGVLAFGICRLIVLAGDALGIDATPKPREVGPPADLGDPLRRNVRVVNVERTG
ncbi:hypothetical protein [Phycisphaera mikurensis]|uniref:DUF3742 family protein n=1 Tax=Phycisphaera mikurensis (strain NBRC 102666 / KCTC 22515 / FYK2301M01) TaxID=1142394 RepID=I0IJ70_PHYMF|nr:hypothetical protein [Phycisphaera mikurensis]MBB6443280.1 hypothetical protein [Phycisphaera mikurensis]BAM05308.1 hypothetical protein PSMK_31490 [Phycisphaera mikurensis NBRC 102666]